MMETIIYVIFVEKRHELYYIKKDLLINILDLLLRDATLRLGKTFKEYDRKYLL